MNYKVGIFIIAILFFVVSVNGIRLMDAKCNEKGSIKILIWATDYNKTYTKDIKIIGKSFDLVSYEKEEFNVDGKWDIKFFQKGEGDKEEGVFISNEALFKKKMKYTLTVYSRYLVENEWYNEINNIEVECPGLFFSCTLLNMTLLNCTNEGDLFYAYFIAKGLNQSEKRELDVNKDLKYEINAKERYLDNRGEFSQTGSIPNETKIEKIEEDFYLLTSRLKNNFIETLGIGYKDLEECRWYDISFRDYKECIKIEKIEEEKNETIKEVKEPIIEKKEEIISSCPRSYIEINNSCCLDNDTDQICDYLEENRKGNFFIFILILVLVVSSIIFIYYKKRKRRWY